MTLLHVATTELPGPRGRRHEEVMARMTDLAHEAAQALLDDAVERLDDGTVTIYTLAESGLPEDVVMQAAADADLLVIARDNRHPSPHSIGHAARFVVDHAPCDVRARLARRRPRRTRRPSPSRKPKAKPKPKPL